MNLYIETDSDGNTIKHPATEENLIAAFGSIPPHWEPFVRVDFPILGLYQIHNEPVYQKINGVWTDVHSVRQMTPEEKAAFQQKEHDWWNAHPRPNLSAWKFNDATCKYEPPIPPPDDGKNYFWQGTTNTWQIMPPYPNDGKEYKLDFPTATWILKT